MKIIYHQAVDHRDDRGRKGRDPRRGRNIPATTLSMSFAIDILHSLCISKVEWDLTCVFGFALLCLWVFSLGFKFHGQLPR